MNTSTLPISKRWHQHLWIISILYFSLGLFNILFAWLGLICVAIPITTAMIKNDKSFCYLYCPRSKMLNLLGHRLKLSRYKAPQPCSAIHGSAKDLCFSSLDLPSHSTAPLLFISEDNLHKQFSSLCGNSTYHGQYGVFIQFRVPSHSLR